MTPTKCLLNVYWAWMMMDSGGAVFIYPTSDGQVKFSEVPKPLTQLWIQNLFGNGNNNEDKCM